MKVTLIGVGGIGSHLAEWTARLLSYLPGGHQLTLVDRDTFEERNRERQAFTTPGNKARVVADRLTTEFPRIRVQAVSDYVTPETVGAYVIEDEVIVVSVDNHETRKVISDAAQKRRNVSIISGGNDLTHGSVQVYLRRDGHDATPSLTDGHPEIREPTDVAPYQLGCEARATSGEPQLFPTNIMVGAMMLAALWRLLTKPETMASHLRGDMETAYNEVHVEVFDLLMRPERRQMTAVILEKEKRDGTSTDRTRDHETAAHRTGTGRGRKGAGQLLPVRRGAASRGQDRRRSARGARRSVGH